MHDDGVMLNHVDHFLIKQVKIFHICNKVAPANPDVELSNKVKTFRLPKLGRNEASKQETVKHESKRATNTESTNIHRHQ